MTLQTIRPLRRTGMTTSNRPLDVLLWWSSDDHGLDMDQPYQRGHVWGETRQRNLIRSLLSEIPIPAIVINDRLKAEFKHDGWAEDRCYSHAVIDGKQRITAIVKFLKGDLAVPASWFALERVTATTWTDDGYYVTFADLTIAGQRFFRNHTIGVAEGVVASLAEEEEIFALINFGGVAQGEKDSDA